MVTRMGTSTGPPTGTHALKADPNPDSANVVGWVSGPENK